MDVFTYGSLMFGSVWSRVVGGDYRSAPALLAGYRRLCVRGETYPGLWPGGVRDRVEGVVYFDLGANDLVRLDRFEGGCYRRQTLLCQVGEQSLPLEVYLFNPACRARLTDVEWDPVAFEWVALPRFVARYRGFMGAEPGDQ